MYARIGRPHTSCMALGRFDFMRVDFPAARMMAVVDIADCGLPIADCEFKSQIGNRKSKMRLPG